MKPIFYPEARRKIHLFWFMACSLSYSGEYKFAKFVKPFRTIAISRDNLGEFYYICDDYEKQYRSLLENFLKNENVFGKFKRYMQKENKLLNFKFGSLDKSSNKELYQLYKKIFSAYARVFRPFSVLRILDRTGIEELNDIIKKRGIKDADTLLITICSTEKDIYNVEEEKEILKAAAYIRKKAGKNADLEGSDIIKKKASELLEKYSWVFMGWFDEPQRDEDYYRRELLEKSIGNPEENLKRYIEKQKKRIEERDALVKKLNLNKKEKLLVRILQESAYLKDYMKGCFMKSRPLSNNIFDEIGRRAGLNREEVMALALEDVENMLVKNKKPGIGSIRERIKYNVIYGKPGKGIRLSSGSEADRLLAEYDKYLPKPDKEAVEFKGRTTSFGRGKGHVRIVRDTKDIIAFKEGEVLVANNTTPDFVPAMKKAAAIVAEEGGITSHTAVVSRELGVPCIIGIENAMEIFKNGDLVEVDADKGIVRKLKKH